MKIDVYAVSWNEEVLMPHFLEHYSFANNITIFDNESTDQTRNIAAKDPRVKIITFHTGGQIDDQHYLKIKNEAWKESRGKADYVIVCDMDEFLYHPELIEYLKLAKERGITIFRPRGFNAVTDTTPRATDNLANLCRYGVRATQMDKCVIFDPDAIEEINYSPGAHDYTPQGRVEVESPFDLKLLHMKYLGPEYMVQRYKQYSQRLSALNKEHGWGNHYLSAESEILANFQKTNSIANHENYAASRIDPENVESVFKDVCERIVGSGFKLDDQCAEVFEEILEVQPGHLPALNNLAVTMFVLARNKDALNLIKKLLSLLPNHIEGSFNYSQMLSAFNRQAESDGVFKNLLSDLSAIFADNPDLPEIFENARAKPHCFLIQLPQPMFVDFN